jgi:DNA-3-methyladenine glycosylase II
MYKVLTLNEHNLLEAVEYLNQIDEDLAKVSRELGAPPLWSREPGFSTLVYIILEQQVSLASARAAFQKLNLAVQPLTPETFLTLGDPQLKEIGFSRQKMGYCRNLAQAIQNHTIELDLLATLEDAQARSALMRLKGIGAWTADIYLMEVLLRPDIWPVSDLALITGVQEVKVLANKPTQDEMEHIAAPWRPWRSVAARMIWTSYLHKRNNYHP